MGQSLNQAELNFYNRQFKVGSVVDDTPVALRIRHTGSAAITSVTVVTGTDLVLIDADGTTTSTFGTDTTLGAVRDTVNAAANWQCEVLDALRADASVSILVNGAITAAFVDGVSYYDALIDTSATDTITFRCAWDRGVGVVKPSAGHRVHVQEVHYDIVHNGTEANAFQIHEWDSVSKTENQILRRVSGTSGADTTVNWASGRGMISAGTGNDLIVRLLDTTSITDDAGNFMNVMYIRE